MSDAAIQKLNKLIEHGRKSVWDPQHDVDWSARDNSAQARELESLSGEQREALRAVLSLVYYSDAQGKQILSTLCRALDRQPPTELKLGNAAHEFFLQQMDDEDRHAKGLTLLFARLGLEPEERALSHLFYSKLLLSEGLFEAKLILIYWYIEVLAKGIFVQLKERFPGTYIDELFTRIIRDEARHVGFGEIFIPKHVESTGKLGSLQMATAFYSSAAAVPALYRFTHYAEAARVLGLDVREMFSDGMSEINAKARRLPAGQSFVDLKRPLDWLSSLL